MNDLVAEYAQADPTYITKTQVRAINYVLTVTDETETSSQLLELPSSQGRRAVRLAW